MSNAPRIIGIDSTVDSIVAHLADGRSISVPLVWSWRLSDATLEQRSNFEIIGNGLGVHWPDIDEDISATGMLYGIPARPCTIDFFQMNMGPFDNSERGQTVC